MKDTGAGMRERSGWRFGWVRHRWALTGAVALLVVVSAPGAAVAVGAEQASHGGQASRESQVAPAAHATSASSAGSAGHLAAAKPPTLASPPASGPSTSAPSPSPSPVLPLSSDQVAAHLGQTVDWLHHLTAGAGQVQIAGVDSVTRDKLHQQALTAVSLAFEFGKACAALLNEQARQEAAATAAAAAAKGPVTGAGDSNGPVSAAATSKSAADTKGFAGRLDEANENVAQRVSALQSQLDGVKDQLTRARGKERETLLAQQSQAEAALTLAKEVQGSVQAMEDFETSSIVGDNGNLSPLEGQIADMQRSVPELSSVRSGGAGVGGSGGRGAGGGGAADGGGRAGRGAGTHGGSGNGGASGSDNGTSGASATGGTSGSNAGSGSASSNSGPSTSNTGPGGASSAGGTSGSATGTASGVSAGNTATAAAASNTFRAESAGVIALVTEWFSLNGTRRQLDDFIKETGDLQVELGKVRGILTDEVRTVVGNDLAISTSTDPTQLLAQRQELEADTVRFKKLSTVLVPLGEQALTVDTVAGTLDDWRTALTTQMSTVARYLALRIGVVFGWVAVVLIVSEVWRRATFRYLHDLRRRRQFMVLRRVAVGIALTVVIVFGLVSEIGSIATYIGFVTAGVAVALQNVILAVVAYFFFIGRYGVRVGDRVTLAGVTGRVVDIGLVRIYLMELSGPDLHSTGRMVVLSNAVLFQPTAMFKQIPGADYAWHTVTLTIAATADVVEAHKRLKAASDEVYAKYRAAIERQHAVVQRFIDFDASSPQPEIRVRLTENGLECAVRYPVEVENAAVIDQRMLKALQEALEDDAQFKLVSSGAVMLKSE